MALATEVGDAPRGAPLGPGSLTWRYLGDVRNVLLAGRAGILQTMHPAIDAGVRQHSDFFVNPLNRIIRSAGPILGAVRTTRKLPAPHPTIDGPAWAAMRPLIGFGAPWLTRGTLPPQAQAILGVSWSRGDELALNGLRALIRTAWPIVPARLSRLPRASR